MATDGPNPPPGSVENPIPFRDQDFRTLQRECLRSGELFADPEFPAEQKSIGRPEDPDPQKAIKWQRPKVPELSALTPCASSATGSCCHSSLLSFTELKHGLINPALTAKCA